MTPTDNSDQVVPVPFGWRIPEPFTRIVLVGVGLIGGSIGLALRERDFQGHIVGFGRRPLEDALQHGAIDHYTCDPAEAFEGAGLVILATPVELITQILSGVSAHLEQGCIVTDVGSVKQTVVMEAESLMPDGCSFVGGHPMAGSEQKGVAAARGDLFEGAHCLLTPTAHTDMDALTCVHAFWSNIGAQVVCMSPLDHDFLVGAASHLPHLVACALMQTVDEVDNSAGRAVDFAATGFRDTTRIAAGSPKLWTHILLQNRDVVLQMVERMVASLQEYRAYLSDGNSSKLQLLLESASNARTRMGRITSNDHSN